MGEPEDLQADVGGIASCRRAQHDQGARSLQVLFKRRGEPIAGQVVDISENVEVPSSQPLSELARQRKLLQVALDLGRGI
ncbi:MAG: hypothetical protein WAL26_10125 [Mycobacterium sp.]